MHNGASLVQSIVSNKSIRSRRGISLVELLATITILGVMGAILVSKVGPFRDEAKKGRDHATARNIVSVYNSASAAGADIAVPGDLMATLQRVVDGVSITRGPLAGRTMRVPNVSEEDLAAAAQYIELRDTELVFTPNP